MNPPSPRPRKAALVDIIRVDRGLISQENLTTDGHMPRMDTDEQG